MHASPKSVVAAVAVACRTSRVNTLLGAGLAKVVLVFAAGVVLLLSGVLGYAGSQLHGLQFAQ